MKNKFKILFSILFLLVLTIIFKKVSAIGLVSQAWIENSNGKRELVYRTFAGPYTTTVMNYHKQVVNNTKYPVVDSGIWKYRYNGNLYTSKWVSTVDKKGIDIPDAYSFKTLGLLFHESPIGNYNSQTVSSPGNNAGYNYSENRSTNSIDSISTIYKNSEQKYALPGNNTGSPRFANNIFYSIWNANSTIQNINWGTGLKASGISANANTDLRHCIVYIDNGSTANSSNVKVEDKIIHSEYLPDLVKKVAEKNNKEKNQLYCYVSEALISGSFNNGYEVAYSAANFFKQYNKQGYSANFWGSGTRGFDSKGMASVLNLFDNKIYFPQMSEREVYVRHIDIGNNTVINENIVNNGKRINPSTPYYLKLTSEKYLASSDTSKRDAYQEYFKGIEIDQGYTKSSLPDITYDKVVSFYTNSGDSITNKDYECIGYNVSTASSLQAAQDTINQNIKAGKYTKGKTVSVDAKTLERESDVTIIDFYYTEYEKNVYVNQIFVDRDGNILPKEKQAVVPNETSKEDGITDVYRINTDKYILETYKKRYNHFVVARTADSLASDTSAIYYGYETFDKKVDIEELIGKSIRSNLQKNNTAKLTSDVVQVNFYYYYDKTLEVMEPDKDVGGQVFVSSTEELTTACQDTYEINNPVTSIPSGTNATVGIKGIPRYMVAAITTEYEPANTNRGVNISFNFTLGNKSKKVVYEDPIIFRVGYFKVTDMAVYKLNDMTIYDADNGDIDTIGTSLFDWKSLKVKPKDKGLTIEMTGINDKPISNTNAAINDINNYVGFKIISKNGYFTHIGNKDVYLTLYELNEVDANGDEVINNDDKTYAQNKLLELESALNIATSVKDNKQANYNNKVSERADLEKVFNEAKQNLQQKVTIYEETTTILNSKISSYENYKTDVSNAEEKLEDLRSELETLENERDGLVQEKLQADEKLRQAETKKSELNNRVQALTDERNTLQQNANCNDSIEDQVNIYGENVYIYLEQSQIDELEECKENKRKYQENLEEKLLETATEEYNSYLNGEYAVSVTKVSDLQKSIEDKEKDIGNKQGEISTQNLNAISARSWLATLYNDKEGYRTKTSHEYGTLTFRDAKEDYENYRDNEYKIAKENYDKNLEDKVVENAYNELTEAQSVVTKAQNAYNSYNSYKENLDAKYDSYKAKYDEFMSINVSDPQQVANKLGLALNITVQNMIIKVNEEPLASARSNSSTETYALSDLLQNSEIPTVTTERPVISKDVYSNIGSTFVEETDYTNESEIDSSVLNGKRTLAGKVNYTLQRVIGEGKAIDVVDRVYYSDQSDDEKTVVFKLKNSNVSKTYKVNTAVKVENETTKNQKYKDVEPINIYTPITVSAKLTANQNLIIDQRDDSEKLQAIQINTPFRIELNNDIKPERYDIENTERFNGGYYIKFDFDVVNVKINGKSYRNGNRIPAGTWIGIINRKNDLAYIEAQPYSNTQANKVDVVTEQNGNYTVRAVAYNTTSVMKTRSLIYNTLEEMRNETGDLIDNICNPTSYFAEETYPIVIINRAYDFRVTDVTDVNWKNVFRFSNSSRTNAHTGLLYYSGTTKWNTKSEKANDIITRTTSEIGRNPLRILPIGPYKSSDKTYIKSPKMGYRFSYDMKVTGAYYNEDGSVNENKKVEIKTKFYYISKDGKNFFEEFDGKSEGIYLFYKNSYGKYIRIDEDGGDYELRFTPNDGYRYIEDSDTSTLSKKSVSLGNLRKILLTSNMATVANNSSYITYYGEYKLPNSTIAVKVDKNGNYNLNQPLNKGYIGVIFDIVAYSGKIQDTDMILSYSKNTDPYRPNTSQWDYEGYLGYTKYGSELNSSNGVSMNLESGTWKITDNKIYNKIKGTVILYDIDQRAATDFD